MKDEYIEFEEYANVVRKAIEDVTHDYNMGEGSDKLQVVYATPPVAFSKFIQDTQNGKKPGPLISFHLSGIEIEQGQQLGGFATLLIGGKTRIRAPIVARLNYEVNINAIKESQADLLQSQLMLSMPFNRPYATTLNGQWVVMEAKDFENLTTVELETDKDKISKRRAKIVVDRAYFNHPFQVNENFIKGINLELCSIEDKG